MIETKQDVKYKIDNDLFDALEFVAEMQGGVGSGRWWEIKEFGGRSIYDTSCPVCINGMQAFVCLPKLPTDEDLLMQGSQTTGMTSSGVDGVPRHTVNDYAIDNWRNARGLNSNAKMPFDEYCQAVGMAPQRVYDLLPED